MSEAFTQVIFRAIAEPEFREILLNDPNSALAGYDLDAHDRKVAGSFTRSGFEQLVGSLMAHLVTPVRASQRVLVIPDWRDDIPTAPGDVHVRLAPTLVFGNGTHGTTRATLDALEACLKPGDAVLDLGVGSGIVSIAAIGLGARSVLALDTDENAVTVARENVRLNGVADNVLVDHGSLPNILNRTLPYPLHSFDLITANILTPVIVNLLEIGLAKILNRGGTLIVSGILETSIPIIKNAMRGTGLYLADVHQSGDWVALVLRHSRHKTLGEFVKGMMRWLPNILTRS
jgi:ribosomal protein L11 methyltransferase